MIKTGVAATTVSGRTAAHRALNDSSTAGPATRCRRHRGDRHCPPRSKDTGQPCTDRADRRSAAQPIGNHAGVYRTTLRANQRPEDTVTVVYADDTGTLRTIENVSCPGPWPSLQPGRPGQLRHRDDVFGSQLNCWITDATGTTMTSQVQTRSFGPPATAEPDGAAARLPGARQLFHPVVRVRCNRPKFGQVGQSAFTGAADPSSSRSAKQNCACDRLAGNQRDPQPEAAAR